MAVSIDWGTYIITVPKADTTLVQTGPPEIRTYSINDFRYDLRAAEETTPGRAELKTHNHNTEVLLSGVTYARILEVLSPYTVTFENGSYILRLTGANHNITDVLNLNNVQVVTSNSAGLVTSAAIEYGEYGGGVTVDTGNITGKAVSGSIYPTGTRRRPCNNIPDAMVLADANGFHNIYILGNITLDTGDDVSDMSLIGENPIQTTITINTGADVTNSEFTHAVIGGVLDGGNLIRKCIIGDLDYVNGEIETSTLTGTITLGGSEEAKLVNCRSGVAGSGTPVIDCGGSGQGLQVRDYYGGIQLTNKTGTEKVSIDMSSGQVKLTNSVTNGEIVCRGVGSITEDLSAGATVTDQMNNTANVWAYER